jgi:predicted transcriptional regulator of viral defense system
MRRTKTDRILEIARKVGVLRPRDLSAYGIAREYLIRLCKKGDLQRIGRGLYTLAGVPLDENQSLRETGKRYPNSVVCLLSALRFHGLTTQAPFQVWLGIPNKAKTPRIIYPPIRTFRFSREGLVQGVEKHDLAGVMVRITDPARTVVDCFRFRHKVGLDVALEAVRDCLKQKKATPDQLHLTASKFRMAKVMRPYLEALV